LPGSTPKRGDIYRVTFDDPVGPHYAVVVTTNAINDNANAVLVAVVTSKNTNTTYPHEFLVPSGLLPKPSKVKAHALVMVVKEEFSQKNYVNTLSDRDIQGLDVALMKALGLWY